MKIKTVISIFLISVSLSLSSGLISSHFVIAQDLDTDQDKVSDLEKKISDAPKPFSAKQSDYFIQFKANLSEGITYYKELFKTQRARLANAKTAFMKELSILKDKLD